MQNRDVRDLVGGLALTLVGLFAAYYANTNYEFGELRRMGPGFFPVVLGLTLGVLGLLVAVPACFRSGEKPKPEWRACLMVLLSLISFAVALKSLGLLLAALISVIFSSLADAEVPWKKRLMIAVGVSVLSYLIFILGLGMNLPVFPWDA